MRTLSIILLFAGSICTATAQRAEFIENRGQWEAAFQYRISQGSHFVFLEENGYTVNLVDPEALLHRHRVMHGEAAPDELPIRMHAYRVNFVGGKAQSNEPAEVLPHHYNYFLGSDPENWQGGISAYKQVSYREMYPGTDLRYYLEEGSYLKYDIVLAPGADPAAVQMSYSGANGLRLEGGQLVVETSVGPVTELAPVAYQFSGEGEKKIVPCAYQLEKGTVSFKLGHYDRHQPLIIDPQLIFSSYTGSTANNFGFTATYSSDGGMYTGGLVFSDGGNYPVTPGAYQLHPRGGNADVGISKFSADGAKLEYSTLLGGGEDELVYSIFEDPRDKSLVLLGSTGSDDFPITTGAFQSYFQGGPVIDFLSDMLEFDEGSDIYVARLDSLGSSLLASTFYGGRLNDGFNLQLDNNYGDDFRGEVVADSLGNVYVVGSTFSDDLPVDSLSFRPSYQGDQDGFVASFSPDLKTLRWASYLGGGKDDNALSVKVYQNQVFVAGGTFSGGMPFPADAWQSQGSGSADGYVVKLNNEHGQLLGGTYNGSAAEDVNYFLDLDFNGSVYVMGQTHGQYPVNSPKWYQNPGSAQFVHRFSNDLKLSERSTVIGDSSHAKCNISPTAFMIDQCRNVYFSGWGGAINILSYKQGYTENLPITDNALQQETDGSDFYFAVMDASWQKLNYATYFGGTNAEHVDGGTSRFAPDGTIFQAVCAGCQGNNLWPTTAGAYATYNGSNSGCNLAALKMQFESQEIKAEVQADVDSACIPYTATLTNLSYNGDIFVWIDPSGKKDTTDLQSIRINGTGLQHYQMIAIDTTCNFVDTTDLYLHGFEDSVYASFEVNYDSCSNDFWVHLQNTSQDADDYFWDFGDGKTSHLRQPKHRYAREGSYTIKLYTTNSYCYLVDSCEARVKFKTRISSDDFSVDYRPCHDGSKARFRAEGSDFQTYRWVFDGKDEEYGPAVSYNFKTSGTHHIRLELEDSICGRYYSRDTSLLVMDAEASLQMANIFTPNGDGQNDFFGLDPEVPVSYFSHYDLRVFNRWGKQVYVTSTPGEAWNGKFRGEALPEGVYYYLLSVGNDCEQSQEYRGYVHLVTD